MKLEKEQGAAHPLKAGRGGYYDIDFMLMYLRLKSAGVYYKVLNTPERIEVLENMGHLDRAGARFSIRPRRFTARWITPSAYSPATPKPSCHRRRRWKRSAHCSAAGLPFRSARWMIFARAPAARLRSCSDKR